MTLFEELTWRGFVNQVTHPDLADTLEKEKLTLYCGFDPTADSLHIGSLLPIIGLMHFQRAGHRPLALVGGGTGLIGDPSFKATERSLLTREAVDVNVSGIRSQLERFLDFSGPQGTLLINNADWLSEIRLLDFLRDFAKYFSVNAMMARDSVRQRLEDRDHGISYTEFSYGLLQAYDFCHLLNTYDCRLQIGGSDQWGNIVAGMDMSRRLYNKSTYGLTFPLVTKADGLKFGKSEGGNIWLDAGRTSPYRFYQFWLNQSDKDTPQYLRFFTFLGQEEILALEKETIDAPHKRAGQRKLAEEVTRMVHGEEALQNAQKATNAMFGGDLIGLDKTTLLDIFSEVPSVEMPISTLSQKTLLLDMLVETGAFTSKGEGRRMVKNGGLYLNNEQITAEDQCVGPESCIHQDMLIIRKGKKEYRLIRFI